MKNEELKIGILYNNDKNWIAGAYYIENLIKALKSINNAQPILYIFTDTIETFQFLQSTTQYPLMEYVNFKFNVGIYKRLINYFCKIIFKRYIFGLLPPISKKLDCVFVGCYSPYIIPQGVTALTWIPDFQEKYLPELFEPKALNGRDALYKFMIKKKYPIVFSSYDALNDFNKFYPNSKNQTYVLQFAVSHPNHEQIKIDKLKEKYHITGDYLFCANQFWVHKNHQRLYEAYCLAKEKGLKLQLVCSGRMHEPRHPEYIEKLNEFIKTNDLENDIINVGFIDRLDQLCLMKNSYAVIQPSLFEGWSTTVEDAKKMNKFIFLSNLDVHKEQNPINVCFFDPYNHVELADKLLTFEPSNEVIDYNKNINQYGLVFLEIVSKLSSLA